MKNITRLTFLLFYILSVITSALIVIKPGAAVFYYKTNLQMEHCVPDAGFAYRCTINLPSTIFPPGEVLLFEDGQQMYRAAGYQLVETGNGAFTTEVTGEGRYYIYFAPTGNSNPLTNDKSYQAYFAVIFLSRTMGLVCLGLLLSGLLQFARFGLSQAKEWKDLRLLPGGPLRLIDRHLAQLRAVIAGIISSANSERRSFFRMWGKLFVFTSAAAYWLVFMEWLFSATGASFMDRMSLGQKLEVFLLSGLMLTCLSLLLLTIVLALALSLRAVRLSWVAFLIAELAPTALLVMMIVLMADNFTYVIFRFGIITSTGFLRIIYGILVGVIFGSIYLQRLKSWKLDSDNKKSTVNFRLLSGITMGLFGISLVVAFLRFDPVFPAAALANQPEATAPDRPNIILIGSDGLTAKNMSIYGYERDTTPTIRELGSTSLLAENAFSNSGNTLGSIVSIFTSKLPTQTGVMYPPDILQGPDALEHLPGILSRAGYRTIQFGVPYYVDAYTMNVQDGFDMVNQRSIYKDPLVSAWRNAGYDLSAYFIYKLEEKLTNRFLHAYYLDTISNPFSVVTQPASFLEDRQKVDQLLTLLNRKDTPLFVHVHLMGTHGPKFNIAEGKYSQGQEQSEDWMVDFYDDAILSIDRYVGEIIDYLKRSGQYDNTILIIYTDHTIRFGIRDRIPMILHFPEDRYAGTITSNVQNLDIAPTILDYLGLAVPDWMNGSSLLSANPGNDRLIFSARLNESKIVQSEQGWGLDVGRLRPPFYQFQAIQVVACERWYELDLWTQAMDSGTIEQHTAPCAESDLPGKEESIQSIIQMLSSQGYDTSSLR